MAQGFKLLLARKEGPGVQIYFIIFGAFALHQLIKVLSIHMGLLNIPALASLLEENDPIPCALSFASFVPIFH
jgi:hypothetical protein